MPPSSQAIMCFMSTSSRKYCRRIAKQQNGTSLPTLEFSFSLDAVRQSQSCGLKPEYFGATVLVSPPPGQSFIIKAAELRVQLGCLVERLPQRDLPINSESQGFESLQTAELMGRSRCGKRSTRQPS